MSLTFDELRKANITRLPQFKNGKGEPAHSEPDGSDWLLSGWSNAVEGEHGEVGEALIDFMLYAKIQVFLGRAANDIKKIERGDTTLELKRQTLADEFADVQTYLDILAFRCGIDLGEATVKKWNAVSAKVGSPLRIGE